jgi:hypothetical protein
VNAIARLFNRIGSDILKGRNVESYVVTMVGIALIILDVVGTPDPDLKITVIIAALVILVFKSTRTDKETDIDLDLVLHDRQSYGPFQDFIRGATELCIYGPSAVNAMRNAADIQREILERGGNVRILLQNPNEQTGISILRRQLDKMFDLESDIQATTRTLKTLASQPSRGKLEYRLLPYSPGFSIAVVDPDGKDGRLTVEFYGYENRNIAERMHINIKRHQSPYWFEYWAKQFDIMWESAQPPDA